MKLKCQPEDFQVEELTDFEATGGKFALYRLTKRSLGTPEAVQAIQRAWKLPRGKMSYGGLKDKHALTVQYVTIAQGPRRDERGSSFELQYLGQAPRPFTPHDITGNRFRVVLRDLPPDEVQNITQACADVAQDGWPNYFDDQRFGSVGYAGEFVAQPWCLVNYERTLWLALADPNEHDRPADKQEKRILQECWGRWAECKQRLPASNRRSIITYLVDHPDDFRGAVGRLNIDLRGLYLSAFQSALWNRLLSALLKQHCQPDQLHEVALKLGPVPFFRGLTAEQRAALLQTPLPLPAARNPPPPGPIHDLLEGIVKEYGLEIRQLRVKYPRDSFFAKGDRAALVSVPELRPITGVDELYADRQKLRLEFDLPRGSYATILIKRLTECGDWK